MSNTTITSGYVTTSDLSTTATTAPTATSASTSTSTTSYPTTTTVYPTHIVPKEIVYKKTDWGTWYPKDNDLSIDWDEFFNMLIKFFTEEKIEDPIDNVIFNYPATIVFWKDGTKTVVKCQYGEIYDKEKGIALCFMKKYFDNKGYFNDIFRKWINEDEEE